MTRSVSSWFIEQSQNKAAYLVNRFTIAGSDYSRFVMRWPSFTRNWNDIRPREIGVPVSNAEGDFNPFRQTPTLLTNSCTLETGFAEDGGFLLTNSGTPLLTHANQPIRIFTRVEYVTLLAGTLRRVNYKDAQATIYATDKFINLSNRLIGTNESPQDFTNSSHLISDLAWYICTSFGGLDATQSTDNADIDYASFLEWSGVMSSNNVRASAFYEGEVCTQALKSIGDLTYTAIFDEDGKIKFKRFSVADSSSNTFNDAHVKTMDISMDIQKVRNRQFVSGGYDVTSRDFSITVTFQNTSTINSFGPQEDIVDDTKTWLVDSVSCLDLAQRLIAVRGEPFDEARISTTYFGMKNSVGDTVTVTDSSAAFSDNFRIEGLTINPNDGSVNMKLGGSQLLSGFILDTSILNGPDVLA